MSSCRCFGTWNNTPDEVRSLQLASEWQEHDKRIIEKLKDASPEDVSKVYFGKDSSSGIRLHILGMQETPIEIVISALNGRSLAEAKAACHHPKLSNEVLILHKNALQDVRQEISKVLERRKLSEIEHSSGFLVRGQAV